MKRLFLFISLIFFSGSVVPVFSADPPCDMKDFRCYEKSVKDTCLDKKPAAPWTNPDNLGALNPNCQYKEFTKAGIDDMIRCMEDDERSNARAIQDGVSPISIGTFSGFRGLEVARLLYRKKMNSIFSCGIVSSRLAKLQALENVMKRDTNGNSEIQRSIERERERYKNMNTGTNCSQNRSEGAPMDTGDRMIRSAMKEYCQYTLYLDYLSRNTTSNITSSIQNDNTIGSGIGKSNPKTTDEMQQEISSRSVAIKMEREKANVVLPKAIRTYREMDRTYIIHIMLTLIYDDYVSLRNKLDKYLVIIGQTFEKAFNAQDARQN